MEDDFIRPPELPRREIRERGEREGDKSNVFDALASMGNDKKNGWVGTSTRDVGSFVAHTVEPACKIQGFKVFSHARSIFSWSQSESAILSYNPYVRSACL